MCPADGALTASAGAPQELNTQGDDEAAWPELTRVLRGDWAEAS